VRVRFERVSKRFGSHPAVREIDLEVEPGECLVLLGPSGCGKTTLLRLLAGLESVDAGRLFIGDRLVNDVPPAERDVAMVFQNYALYPHLSVHENIAFPLRARHVEAAEVERRVREAAGRLELGTLLDRRPAQLSGGQQQRVALARAIVRKPAVYLMDEPLSNLDAQLRAQTRGELKRLQQELGTTTVYVTHDQGEAMTLGSRVALLRAGVVEQLGPPLELYRRPVNRFVAGFLGSPAINLLSAEPDAPGRLRAAGALVLPPAGLPLTGPVELGVRPEDVEVADGPRDGFAPARLLTAEPMGNETVVTLEASGQRVVARAAPDFAAAPGAHLFFRFATGRLLFFDESTGFQLAGSRPPA
jgi:sn-glycerol 3-phosphate transport system ATP-binding protein/multiple sugar transport system ATP-binding protein